MKHWKMLVVAAALVLASSITYAAEEGGKAADFTLLNLSQKKVNFSDYQGKVRIVDFWDTYCYPCKMEIPDFVKLQKKWKNKLQIIGVAFGRQGLRTVKAFAKKYKMNYPVVICDDLTLKKYGPLEGIPTTFVIDRKGKIYKKYIGYRPGIEKLFEADIEKLTEK